MRIIINKKKLAVSLLAGILASPIIFIATTSKAGFFSMLGLCIVGYLMYWCFKQLID